MKLSSLPWINEVANIMNEKGYEANINISDKARCDTRNTVQLYDLWKKWYPNGIKCLPDELFLTPTSVLVWFFDDGGVATRTIRLHTESFTKQEVHRLAKLLKEATQIEAKVRKRKNQNKINQPYFILQITGQKNISRFYNYLEQADPKLTALAMKLAPHKFKMKKS